MSLGLWFFILTGFLPNVSQVGAQDLLVYPSYRPRFHADTETFTLRSTIYLVNTGEEELQDLVLRQETPEGITVASVTLSPEEQARRPEGFSEAAEGNTYEMRLPVLRPQQGALLLSELNLERRVGKRVFPGLSVEYTLNEEREGIRLPKESYDLSMYSDHVGSLVRFLKRRAKISLELTSGRRKVWEFASRDSTATGSNPTGILGVEREEVRKGQFRLRAGHPGDLLEILVVWRPVKASQRIQDHKKLLSRLEEYMRWVGDFRFQPTSLKLKRTKFIKYKDAWVLDGRWEDSVANRLGEGPFRWISFHSPREGVEYFLLLLAQARGLGPEASKTPQPEREAGLMEELYGYMETFQSSIVPYSYKKR